MMFDWFGGAGAIEDEGIPWKSIGFALFGGAALLAAFGYAITRPMQELLDDSDDEKQHSSHQRT